MRKQTGMGGGFVRGHVVALEREFLEQLKPQLELAALSILRSLGENAGENPRVVVTNDGWFLIKKG